MTSPPPPAPPTIRRRFLRIMRFAALLSIVTAAVAVVLVARGQDSLRIHMLIATALGAGLSVMLGTALMTLMFLSNRHGADTDASAPFKKDDQ